MFVFQRTFWRRVRFSSGVARRKPPVVEGLEPRALMTAASGVVQNVYPGPGGVAVTTPLAGWTVFDDANRNGVRDQGETMAVTIILSVSGVVTFNLISQSNPSTIAANIALDFPESSGIAINTLIATGLVLFAITLVTNMAARAVINRQNTQ